MKFEKVMILDGYTDEPAGLGVPPYIGVYPRYIAGAIWCANKDASITYVTVDSAREMEEKFFKLANSMDVIIIVAGVTVPGKYLGGNPITIAELNNWFKIIDKPLKILAGPAARFGIGIRGGKVAELPWKMRENFDIIIKGDPEIVVYRLFKERSVEFIEPDEKREDYVLTNEFSVKGARIVEMHPNHGKNLIAEIETYRGCPRFITGGCSFCTEPLYGEPVFRDQRDIAREVEALHRIGVKFFRLGRQPDIFAYKAVGVGEEEFPKPSPIEVEKLFKSVVSAAPELEVLHIDNVNPGTIAHHPEESREIAKIIVKYHTPGDVAAMGVESADPVVIKKNNLKASPEESYLAIKIVNEVGSVRGWNGLPHLLPGVNFVYGLIGETKETYKLNYEFMKRVLDSGLMVRRINIRKVMAFPGTPMWRIGDRIIRKHKRVYDKYLKLVRARIDLPMLRRVVPKYTVLRRVYTEKIIDDRTYSRQIGSYPIMVVIPFTMDVGKFIDVVVTEHSHRSVMGLPYPIKINETPIRALKSAPGITKSVARKIMLKRPFRSVAELRELLGEYSKYYEV